MNYINIIKNYVSARRELTSIFKIGKTPLTQKLVKMANSSRIWKEKKEKLKGKYPIITDNDLSYRQGEENEMMKVLRTKLGKTNEELLKIIVML